MGIGGSVFNVIDGFLSGRIQRVVVDGGRREDVRVVSSVPQDSVLGPLLLLLYTSDLPIIIENFLLGYARLYTLLEKEFPKLDNRVPAELSNYLSYW